MADFLTLLSQALAPLQGSLATRGWSLNNAWPTMIGQTAQKALPRAGGALSSGSGGLPMLFRAAAMSPSGGTSGLGRAVATAGGAATDVLGNTLPANQGEQPFYIYDAQQKKWVPNPAAAGNMPAGSFGFGGGYQPQALQYGVPTNYDGANSGAAGGSIPLPRPRPQMPVASSVPAQAAAAPGSQAPAQNPGLIQRFLAALQGSGNSNPNNAYGYY